MSPTSKLRILFLCTGNSCRSQMAEGFARAYGADVLEVQSAGLSPASMIQPLTVQTMLERNIRLDGQFPKGIELMVRDRFDVVVNMSGQRLNMPAGLMLDWNVRDPIGCTDDVYRNVAMQLESLVMSLVIQTKTEFQAAR